MALSIRHVLELVQELLFSCYRTILKDVVLADKNETNETESLSRREKQWKKENPYQSDLCKVCLMSFEQSEALSKRCWSYCLGSRSVLQGLEKIHAHGCFDNPALDLSPRLNHTRFSSSSSQRSLAAPCSLLDRLQPDFFPIVSVFFLIHSCSQPGYFFLFLFFFSLLLIKGNSSVDKFVGSIQIWSASRNIHYFNLFVSHGMTGFF